MLDYRVLSLTSLWGTFQRNLVTRVNAPPWSSRRRTGARARGRRDSAPSTTPAPRLKASSKSVRTSQNEAPYSQQGGQFHCRACNLRATCALLRFGIAPAADADSSAGEQRTHLSSTAARAQPQRRPVGMSLWMPPPAPSCHCGRRRLPGHLSNTSLGFALLAMSAQHSACSQGRTGQDWTGMD